VERDELLSLFFERLRDVFSQLRKKVLKRERESAGAIFPAISFMQEYKKMRSVFSICRDALRSKNKWW